jgi:hypothetical protein
MISLILSHSIPSSPPPSPFPLAWQYYIDEEQRDSYNHFKKYFHNAIFLHHDEIRKYAINKAISNHNQDYYYIEFGVRTGDTINEMSGMLKGITIYGFDSFEGLREDWKGYTASKGRFNRNKQVPRLNDNCVPVVGWIQDTFPKFIAENEDMKINFVHIDTDTYPTAKFILQQIRPYLINDSIIIFDELYNFPGWSVGEYKALTEVFSEEEYEYLAFSKSQAQVVIQYKKRVVPT